MNRTAMPITILMADDDADDRRLTQEAFEEGRLINDVRFVENGEQLLEYLRKQGAYAPPAGADPAGPQHAAQRRANSTEGIEDRSGVAADSGGRADHVEGGRRYLQE